MGLWARLSSQNPEGAVRPVTFAIAVVFLASTATYPFAWVRTVSAAEPTSSKIRIAGPRVKTAICEASTINATSSFVPAPRFVGTPADTTRRPGTSGEPGGSTPEMPACSHAARRGMDTVMYSSTSEAPNPVEPAELRIALPERVEERLGVRDGAGDGEDPGQ